MIPSAGVSLKPQHFDAALAAPADGLWFEIHPENYMVEGGPRLAWLDAIRADHPLSLHGVALSLAAAAPPDVSHLSALSALVERLQPALVSEHLAWSVWRGTYFPDLLPFPRSTEALERIVENVSRVQDVLRRRIAIENPSHYVSLEGHEYDEIAFLEELTRRSGCGLLLDVNNVFVSAHNMRFPAVRYIDAFPADRVLEIHLAGHSRDPALRDGLLVDSHDAPVAPEVWALYRRFVDRAGPRPTLIERDGNIPEFEALLAEREHAQELLAVCASATRARKLGITA
jgi:uncharacterized protein (UPF0276 family)